MIEEFEDDTHYCIKCSTMIIGLDNYVTHRKTNCGKNINHDEDLPKSPLSSQLLAPEDPFGLKADDFFSSLELQSSSKKHPPSTSGGKSFSGVLTRSKTLSFMHAPPKEPEHSKSGKNAWIGGHQLKVIGGEDNHSKLIKAVDNLSRNASLKKELLTPYEESDEESDDYYFDEDSDTEEDEPPRHHTGGKWKPSSSPIEWQNRSWSSPPANYTGGKWKPGAKRSSSPPPTHTRGKWKPSSPNPAVKEIEVPKPSFTGGKWKSKIETKDQEWDIVEFNVPPPGHTKGKWKPVQDDQKNVVNEKVEKKSKLVEDKKDKQKVKSKIEDDAPPPTHTKGKWRPTKLLGEKDKPKDTLLRKSSGRVQYWCGACNRRLTSKIVYERHLKTELHLKRSQQEFDDSSHLNTTAKALRPTERERDLRKDHWSHTNRAGDNKDAGKISRRTRRRTYVKCGVCRSRVHTQMMGKHLISHYHCRKGDITLPEAREMVLENIHSIVLQSPYQCATCRFYCNTQVDFLRHWCSVEHEASACKFAGTFSCALCKFQTPDNKRMLEHLLSAEHKEVISVINRSVPIVIKKLNYVACQTCDVKFLLNIQLRKHCEREKHPYASTASDTYQSRNNCDKCDQVFKSKIALQRHKKRVHKDNFYLCSVCDLTFTDVFDAKRHRSSTEHRVALQTTRPQPPLGKETRKKCIYCRDFFENIIQLKNHLKEKHPEHNYSCSLCGETFIIAQDLTVHLRKKSCTYSSPVSNDKTCDVCPFSTTFESEMIFHKVLHDKPVIMEDGNTKCRGSTEKYKCPICDKFFTKASLRCHIRLHTKERPYACKICNNVSFVRKSNWLLHMKRCGVGKEVANKPTPKSNDSKLFLCSTCGMSFKRRSILHMHMIRHTGKSLKCEKEGCIFAARTAAELKEHKLTHSDNKPFKCETCDYSGKSKKQLERHKTIHTEEKKFRCSNCPFTTRIMSHLKRHTRLHTGSKPYACPHCKYRSNNLENLRKHVLSTNKHPGKCIYECKFCSANNFQGNFAKEFRIHLVTEHPDVFKTGTEAVTYITGIYEAQEDMTTSGDKSETTKEEIYHLVPHEASTQSLSTITVAGPSTLLTTSAVENKVQDNFFPLYVSSKDITCVDNQTDTWSLVEKYGEAGALVTFESDGETLFEEI